MSPNPTPKEKSSDAVKSEGRTYSKPKPRRREPNQSASYTSPYWETYGKQDFKYAKGPTVDQLEDSRSYSDDYFYPMDRDSYGCGWEGEYSRNSVAGWKRALQDPSLVPLILIAGAIGTYLVATAIPEAFRKKKKRSVDVEFDDGFLSGKI